MILSNDNKYRGNLGSTLKLDEYSHVEKPFLEQLAGLGWDVLELQMQQQPEQSFRTSFSEVVLKPKLREALMKINPFLTAPQVDELERKITTFQKNIFKTHTSVSWLLISSGIHCHVLYRLCWNIKHFFLIRVNQE